MNKYTRSEIVSGIFVAAAIALFALVAFRIGAFDPFAAFRAKPAECVARFSDAKGLAAGGRVMVAGKQVGKVDGVRIVEAALDEREVKAIIDLFGQDAFPDLKAGMMRQIVEVSFGVTDADLRVDKATARVSISKDGIFGEYYLSLDPGYWSGAQAALMASRPTTPLQIEARDEGGLDSLLAQLGPVVRRVQSILANVDENVLTSKNLDAISATIENISAGTADLREMLRRDNPEGVKEYVLAPLNRLLTNADQSLSSLRDRLLNETLKKAEDLMDQGKEMAESVDKVAKNAQDLLTEVRPNVQAMIDDLAAASKDLNARLATLGPEVEEAARQAKEMLAENRPELAETVRRLRRTMWEAEMAMRKIRSNPAYLIFGDNEKLLDELPYDETGLRKAGRVRPYNQRDESDGGR
ncbi:MAG: MlaD family protein [Vicinamibacterales bacterium]